MSRRSVDIYPDIFFPQSGNVKGPASGVDNNIVLFNGTGKSIKDSGKNISNVAFINENKVFTKSQAGAVNLATDGGTITLDLSLPNFKIVLGGSRTLGVPSNIVAGASFVFNVWQDSTGSRLLTYAWCFQFPSGAAVVLSTGKFQRDQLYLYASFYGTSTVTMTLATPGAISWSSHGMISGQKIQFTTTGALPTGLAASTTYWVSVVDANTFNVASSLANLQAGTFIATSGSQSGVHTATAITIDISNNLAMQ